MERSSRSRLSQINCATSPRWYVCHDTTEADPDGKRAVREPERNPRVGDARSDRLAGGAPQTRSVAATVANVGSAVDAGVGFRLAVEWCWSLVPSTRQTLRPDRVAGCDIAEGVP